MNSRPMRCARALPKVVLPLAIYPIMNILTKKYVTKNPPCDKQRHCRQCNRDRVNAHIEARMPCPVQFKPEKRSKQRQKQKQNSVVVPCGGNVTMQQGMKHALAATAGTLPSRQFMKEAFRHKPGYRRIYGKIHCADRCDSDSDKNICIAAFQASNDRGR